MSTKPLAHQVMPGAGDAESVRATDGAVRPRDSLFHWCGTVDAILQTTKDDDKRALMEAYFGALAEESVVPAARYLSGVFFEDPDATVSPAVVTDVIEQLARVDIEPVRDGDNAVDLGAVAATAFAGRLPSGVAVSEVAEWGDELAQSAGTDKEQALVREMLARVSSLEARYLVRLMVGTLGPVVDNALLDAALEQRRSRPGRDHGDDRRKSGAPTVGVGGPARRRRRRAP